jgi:putative membrane protein
MHIVRTIVWVLLAVWGLFFIGMNWGDPVPVVFWPVPIDNKLMVEQPVSLVAVIFFLLGLLPVWLYGRAQKWMFKRRIRSLENAARTAAVPATAPSPELMPEAPSYSPLTTEPETSHDNRPPLT